MRKLHLGQRYTAYMRHIKFPFEFKKDYVPVVRRVIILMSMALL